jgi:hypothetical protein
MSAQYHGYFDTTNLSCYLCEGVLLPFFKKTIRWTFAEASIPKLELYMRIFSCTMLVLAFVCYMNSNQPLV